MQKPENILNEKPNPKQLYTIWFYLNKMARTAKALRIASELAFS